MIGFNRLGRQGLLANQMFQYAGLRGIAAHHGYEFCIPPSEFRDRWTDHQLFEAFRLTGLSNVGTVSGDSVSERHFAFDDRLFENTLDGQSIGGFLQSERYFKHIATEIRQDLRFKDEIRESALMRMSGFDHPIALHVRRGDYLTNAKNHPPCTKRYYRRALKHFDRHREVVVFSDDPDWCRRQRLFSGDRFTVSESGDSLVDLCSMTLCHDFIIANSTYSWWGAWLSENVEKRVVAPGHWFGTGYTAAHDTSDLYCQGWIVVDE